MRERAYDGDEHEAAGRWHDLEEEHYTAYLTGALTFEGQRRARAADFAREFGDELDDPAAGAWFAEYFRHYRDSWALHDDVLPAFDALATALPGVRFGIVTNGELEFQMAKVVRLALHGRIGHVIASGEVGIAKPDPGIFHEALDRFGRARPGLGGGLRRRPPRAPTPSARHGPGSSASGSTGTASALPTTRRPRRSTPAWSRSTASTSSPRSSCRACAEHPWRGRCATWKRAGRTPMRPTRLLTVPAVRPTPRPHRPNRGSS